MEQTSKYHFYDEHGQKKIPFKDCNAIPNIQYLKICVINAEYIRLRFEKSKCTLGFVDLGQKQYEEIEISQEPDEDIFKSLQKHYQKNETKDNNDQTTTTTISKEELDRILYDLIEKKSGKTRSIDLACNRICYVAGVLFKALEFARSGSTLNKFLFPIHFF